MENQELIYSLKDLGIVAEKIIGLFPKASVFAFSGPLGVGKTKIISEVFKKSGINCAVASPTFTYLNTYEVQNKIFHHFDLYRIKSQQNFLEAGFDEYLYQPNSHSFIEWPEVIEPIIKKKSCFISIEYAEKNFKNTRKIRWNLN